MKLSEKDWAKFGRWMMVISGIFCLIIGFYDKEDLISLALKIWVVSFGIYCIYIALFK